MSILIFRSVFVYVILAALSKHFTEFSNLAISGSQSFCKLSDNLVTIFLENRWCQLTLITHFQIKLVSKSEYEYTQVQLSSLFPSNVIISKVVRSGSRESTVLILCFTAPFNNMPFQWSAAPPRFWLLPSTVHIMRLFTVVSQAKRTPFTFAPEVLAAWKRLAYIKTALKI